MYSDAFVSAVLFLPFLETLNRLLGSSDAVNDIKMNFIHNLCTPRKLSMPHGHLIKDMMRPDFRV